MAKSKCWECMDSGQVWAGDMWCFCGCPAGVEFKKRHYREQSGIPQARWTETFDTFRLEPGTKKALAAAHRFAGGELGWLMIYGGCGNGKTHLAHAAGLALIDQGKAVRFANALCLVSELRAVMGVGQLTLLNALGNVPYLILDEFFWATDWEGQRLEEIVARRYAEKRPLFVTTNKDLLTIPQPILSRFKEMGDAVQDSGKDVRAESQRGKG